MFEPTFNTFLSFITSSAIIYVLKDHWDLRKMEKNLIEPEKWREVKSKYNQTYTYKCLETNYKDLSTIGRKLQNNEFVDAEELALPGNCQLRSYLTDYYYNKSRLHQRKFVLASGLVGITVALSFISCKRVLNKPPHGLEI